jgi:hypothetical protein
MRTIILIAALGLATPALAQQAQPEPAPRPLPADSFQWDSNRKDLKSFEPPSRVIIGDGPRELPPGSLKMDGVPLKPFRAPAKPEPEKKPAKGMG